MVSSSPLLSMTRRVVSPGSMVTMRPAWGRPTWMCWRATPMPPRLDTLRWITKLADGSGFGPASRTPCSLCRWLAGMGQGRVRHSSPSWGDDVHDLAVQADAGALPGQRGADRDDLVGEGDDAGGVDQPLDFHAAGRGQGAGRGPGRGRSCRGGTGLPQPGYVDGRQPGRHRLDTPPVDAQVHGDRVDPEPDLLPGPAGAEPELLRADGQVSRRRDHPVDLDGIWPLHRLNGHRVIRSAGSRGGDGLKE